VHHVLAEDCVGASRPCVEQNIQLLFFVAGYGVMGYQVACVAFKVACVSFKVLIPARNEMALIDLNSFNVSVPIFTYFSCPHLSSFLLHFQARFLSFSNPSLFPSPFPSPFPSLSLSVSLSVSLFVSLSVSCA
jgi:hypothetical protein